MRTIVHATLAAMLVLTLVVAVQAKGIPSLVIVKGARLPHPIEITDPEILKKFSPWLGEFIDAKAGAVATPKNQSQVFEILIYMKSRSGELRLIYSITYCPSQDDSVGYIFLPGKDDPRYRTNASTILRDNDDGKWHMANPVWEKPVKRLITAEKT